MTIALAEYDKRKGENFLDVSYKPKIWSDDQQV